MPSTIYSIRWNAFRPFWYWFAGSGSLFRLMFCFRIIVANQFFPMITIWFAKTARIFVGTLSVISGVIVDFQPTRRHTSLILVMSQLNLFTQTRIVPQDGHESANVASILSRIYFAFFHVREKNSNLIHVSLLFEPLMYKCCQPTSWCHNNLEL